MNDLNDKADTSEPTATDLTPAMAASRESWRCVQTHDKAGWLALMADDVLIEDPIGQSITNPDGTGVRGKQAVEAFYDTNIATNDLTVTCEESFPSSSPQEVAHLLTLRSRFDDPSTGSGGAGLTSIVRGVFAYRVDEAGLLTNLRGWWNLDAMRFERADA